MRRWVLLAVVGAGVVWACSPDGTLRAYLSPVFWQPFVKQTQHFERANVSRTSEPYAGMGPVEETPLGRARAAYRKISTEQKTGVDVSEQRTALQAARLAVLRARDQEEVQLIDAKIDLRAEAWAEAQKKLETFLRTAQTPEYVSEARGWLARAHRMQGEQTKAGKLYLDELNRAGSNLSRETVMSSLFMTYGYGESPGLREHIEDYFDTPEHAAFAVQMWTNPTSDPVNRNVGRLLELLNQHRELFTQQNGAERLALLSMRVALRMGDPGAAREIAEMVPASSAVRRDPDFLWMQAAARWVERDYAGAEAPLVAMFETLPADDARKKAAAYGLCGVYRQLGRPVDQLRYALWLNESTEGLIFTHGGATVRNMGVYWASSGWDLGLLLEMEAPNAALEGFVRRYPKVPNVEKVRYALAVRYARANRYGDSAAMYRLIGEAPRAARMEELARLWADRTAEGKYRFADFVSQHANGIYFNASLWEGFQRYALQGEQDPRFAKEDREAQAARERKLRDDQEELWRAASILRQVVREAGRTPLGEKAARLAVKDLRRIRTDRFGRAKEIAAADIELTRWLQGR